MRNLFDLDSNMNVTISPDAYSLPIFKKLWDRDNSKNKSKALMDLAYIFWISDYRSYLSDITNIEEKKKEVISIIDDSGKYKPDSAVEEAIQFYKKDVPISLGFLEDVKTAINELRKYFRELDLTSLDDKGKPIHNANQVMNSIKSTGDLLENLEKLEIKVKKDLDMNNSVRGAKSKGMYED
jgi:hypothetical protein